LNKGISIDWNIQSEIPLNLKGDNVRLTQILGNLLSNSIKFTYEGQVKIEVSLVSLEGLKCMLKFNIIDSGIGIDEVNQSKLFQAFSQIDSSQSKSEQGTGLGLHISQKLISLMGGSITFNSIPGVGTTFSVYLPFIVELGSHIKYDLVPTLDTEQDLLDNISILVIDDNSTNLKVAYSLLHHCGATVTTALTGLEGLHKVLYNSVVFDYVLLDIQMPIIDGIETFMLFKTIANYNKPIIALTAYSMLGDRERYLNIGFTSYLAKPITIESIVNLFRNRMDWNYDVTDFDSMGSSYLINLKQVNDLLLILGLDNFLASLTDLDSEFYGLLYDLKVNDADLARILHTIKGSVSTIGLAKLADIASFYENSYKKFSIINVVEAHDLLASIYQNSIKFVHTIISSSSSHGKDSIDS
jgi:CheY-like chemotaxis protein